MDSLAREDVFFTNLLEESNMSIDFVMESEQLESPQCEVCTKQSPSENQLGSIAKKPARGVKFTVEEDLLLVSAWLNISMDPIVGNQQKRNTYWDNIYEYFEKERTSCISRSANSLMHRWSTIQVKTNKFCGCLAQVERRNESGLNEQDKICRAKEMFRSLLGAPFQFEHCWNVLRHNPKWVDHCAKEKQKKRPAATSSASEPIQLEENDASQAAFVNLERPLGRKSEKARLNKRKSSDSLCANLEGILTDMQEAKKLKSDGKKEILERASSQTEQLIQIRKAEVDNAKARDQELIQLKQEKIKLERAKQEMEIIMMDISSLTAQQQHYIRQRRLEIIERQTKTT
uniref:No apical meristem-associated C-terminal domain-containing protein n=1 Tax=Fagus sylvatica TaxID=28930 RepID=A0A2N9IL80_FAGSY